MTDVHVSNEGHHWWFAPLTAKGEGWLTENIPGALRKDGKYGVALPDALTIMRQMTYEGILIAEVTH